MGCTKEGRERMEEERREGRADRGPWREERVQSRGERMGSP